MFTASHNPAQYNGIKMCRAGAKPIGQDSGLAEIRALVEGWLAEGPRSRPLRPAGWPSAMSSRTTRPTCAAWWTSPPSAR